MSGSRALLLGLLAFGLPTVTSAAAEGVQFKPNHMFVPVTTSVLEYDEEGELVRSFAPEEGFANNAGSVAFAPDGTLLVGDADRIVRFDGSGSVVETLDVSSVQIVVPSITMGPGGHIFATDHFTFIREYTSSGTLVDSIGGFTNVVALAFGPDGHLLAADDVGKLHEYDPSGVLIRTIDGAGPLRGVCVSPGGVIAVTQADGPDLVYLDQSGAELLSTTNSGASSHSVVGPDWSVYTCFFAQKKVRGYVGNVETHDLTIAGTPLDVAFAPFRLKVSLKGRIAGLGDVKKFKENAVLSIAPGSGRLMLQFEDDPEKTSDYASAFGSDAFVGYGLEGNASESKTERIYTALEVRGPALTSGVGNLSLVVTGKMDVNGFFRVKSAKGSFSRTAGLVGLQATVTSKGGPLK